MSSASSRPGTYTYTVAEVEGSDSTITYDKTVYTAVIQVADDLQGHLVASVADQSGAGLDMTFTNKYTEPAKDVPDSSGPDTRKGVRTGDTAPILPVVAVMGGGTCGHPHHGGSHLPQAQEIGKQQY